MTKQVKPLMKPIPGFNGDYSITLDGQVFSNRREQPYKMSIRRKGNQPPRYHLSVPGKGQCSYTVASLLLKTFQGPCPKGYQVGYHDGDVTNFSLPNLRWIRQGTRSPRRLVEFQGRRMGVKEALTVGYPGFSDLSPQEQRVVYNRVRSRMRGCNFQEALARYVQAHGWLK